MSVKALSHVWQHTNQRGARLLVLLALADNADDGGWSWYSVAKIAKKSRQDVRATRNYLYDLHADGDILIYERKQDDGGNHSNLYRVNFPGATMDMPEIIGDVQERPKPEQRKVRGAGKKKGTGKITSGGTGKKREGGTGKKRESDPSVEPSVEPFVASDAPPPVIEDSSTTYRDIRATLNERMYLGSGRNDILSVLASWLGGSKTEVKVSRGRGNAEVVQVRACAPQATVADVKKFAHYWRVTKKLSPFEEADKFVRAYLDWMDTAKPAHPSGHQYGDRSPDGRCVWAKVAGVGDAWVAVTE